jgi:hypothetical protein
MSLPLNYVPGVGRALLGMGGSEAKHNAGSLQTLQCALQPVVRFGMEISMAFHSV